MNERLTNQINGDITLTAEILLLPPLPYAPPQMGQDLGFNAAEEQAVGSKDLHSWTYSQQSKLNRTAFWESSRVPNSQINSVVESFFKGSGGSSVP